MQATAPKSERAKTEATGTEHIYAGDAAPSSPGDPLVSLADVQAAYTRVKDLVRHTPMKHSSSLTELTQARELHLKFENFQITGSFKVRGALNKIAQLTPAERKAGVVAASAGNHAQGVAYAARKAGVACTIFMPEEATLSKVYATRGYGAKVNLVGKDYQECFEKAKAYAESTGATYVHAFDDPLIIAGAGTLGIELHNDLGELDVVLVPIGGGGLISGVATALKGLNPKIKVIGVQAEGASTIAPSLEKGGPVTLEAVDTMADGIAVRKVGQVTWRHIKARVDQVVTVTESEIAAAILYLLERAKVVVEGAGAVTLAAAMSGKVPLEGKRVACVLSGGNIDMMLLSRIIRRGLVSEGRIAVIHATISDRPGSLASFLALLAREKASVIDLHHDRHRVDISLNRTGIEVHVETRGPDHVADLQSKLKAAGYEAQVVGA